MEMIQDKGGGGGVKDTMSTSQFFFLFKTV